LKPLDKRHAEDIAKKLGAQVTKDGKHQLAEWYEDGKKILEFGIRHGGKSSHGHLVGEKNGDLRLNASRAYNLATCTFSKLEYIDVLKKMNFWPKE
jgi:general stress protein YciG